eukprot:TRINITY_DN6101_c0_g2_i2.p1 TRINITY_DN6101_c0_g2~~TRINITY_DN6101_c0_g2_i2.p1  ORF type:complete len:735 (+),score=112.93 TRINITY_DN6101_c0_g2_i2:77-2281(+)
MDKDVDNDNASRDACSCRRELAACDMLAEYREKCQREADRFLAAHVEATEDLLRRIHLHPGAPSALKRPGLELSKAADEQVVPPEAGRAEKYTRFDPGMDSTLADGADKLPSSLTPTPHPMNSASMDCAAQGESSLTPTRVSSRKGDSEEDAMSEGEQRLRSSNLGRRVSLSSQEEFQAAAEGLHLGGYSKRRHTDASVSRVQTAVEWSLVQTLGKDNTIIKNVALELQATHEANRTGTVYRIVESPVFQMMSLFVILLNTVFIVDGINSSIDAAWGKQQSGLIELDSDLAMIVDTLFLLFYLIEVVLRLYAYRLWFFFTEEALWNILDLALVLTSLISMVISLSAASQEDGGVQNAYAVRSARVFKIAKLVRVVRAVRFFKQLHLFVTIILDCFQNLFWAVMTIVILLLLFSIYFVHSMEVWISKNWSPDATEEIQEISALIAEAFGSIRLSMLTLSATLSGGRDWYDVYSILRSTGMLDCIVFLTMQAFFQVAVWNIVASVFIENTFKNTTVDREEQAFQQRQRDTQDAKEFFQLCKLADADGSGTISWSEFEALMAKEDIQDFFAAKHLDVKNAESFFKMVQAANEGVEVELEDFVGALLRLKGNATSIDLQMLVVEHRQLASKTKKFMPVVQDAISTVSRKTDQILAFLDSQQMHMAHPNGANGAHATNKTRAPSGTHIPNGLQTQTQAPLVDLSDIFVDGMTKVMQVNSKVRFADEVEFEAIDPRKPTS